MRTSFVKNGLVMVVILLFIGVAVQPSIATVQQEEEINTKPKDYLFQTIIDIASNPDVKNLIEQYEDDWKHNNGFLNYDIDRNFYRKIFFRNPWLFSSLIFTKPSVTYKYLESAYEQGCKIVNTLGEDKALEMIESIKINNPEVLEELNNIIMSNDELSNRLTILEEMNKELKPDIPLEYNPVVCAILTIILSPVLLLIALIDFFYNFLIIDLFFISILLLILPIIAFPCLIILEIGIDYGCWDYPSMD